MNKKSCLYKAIRLVYHEIVGIPSLIKCIVFQKNTIILRSWIVLKNGKLMHRNWGDDINKFFFEEITGRKVLFFPNTYISKLFPIKNITAIGSILAEETNENSIIWGTGLCNNITIKNISVRPKKILAVRGPLTRDWLLQQHINCPEIYGDPALLLPLFYQPKKNLKKRIGIIPHMTNLLNNDQILKELLQNKDALLIKTTDYGDWHDFIDSINSCEFVISESLHGLIVSEAYCIPSIWVEFSHHIDGWDFKFQDFYASIGKYEQKKIVINTNTTIEELLKQKEIWVKGNYNPDMLIKSCPFSDDIFNKTGINKTNNKYIYANYDMPI